MTEKVRKEIIGLASKIIHLYFGECNVEFLISTFADDIVWIGGGEKQQAEGKESVSRFFREGKEDLAPCDITKEHYVAMQLGEGHYLCEGDSWLEAKKETKLQMKIHQRITFIFKRIQGELKCVHIHNSVPYTDIQDDELFPKRAAHDAYVRLQTALTEKNQQIELMLSQLPGGMVIYYRDKSFSIKWLSDGVWKILGYESYEQYEEKTRNCYKGFVHIDDYEKLVQEVEKSFLLGNTYLLEYRIEKKDGSYIWVSNFGKRVIDKDNEEVIICFITDITTKKEQELLLQQANIELKRQANFLSQLFDTIPCGIMQFSIDETHKIINSNRRVWEIYGYEKDNYWKIAQDPFFSILPEEQKKYRRFVKDLSENGGCISYERQGKRSDNSICYVSVTMERLINANGVQVIQAVFNDITERKLLEQERQREQLIENRSLRAAICIAYPFIISINLTQNTFQLFFENNFIMKLQDNYINYDVLFNSFLSKIHPSYQEEFINMFQRQHIISQFQKGEKEIYLELKQKGDDDVYHWLSIHCIHVDNPYSRDVLAIALFRVLDEKRAEKARQEQLLRDALTSARAANNAKSDFLSRMSHDIRTPMNAIIGMSAIGQLKLDNRSRVKDCFEKIDASSRYLLSLINDILDMSKIEQGKMSISHTKFDFQEFVSGINTIIYPQSLEHNIGFEIRHKEPLEKYYIGDALRLNQILMNLLSNSLKFTPKGGKILVEIQEKERNNGFAFLEFIVSDTGIGMSEEFLSKLYQPFEQESPDMARNKIGSGLGLSIVYNLVQLMGGSIQAKSRKNKGSSFQIVIPFEVIHDDEEKERLRKSKELLRNIHVLVVDDDEIIGDQTAMILSNIGAYSVWVNSGQKAIKEVKKSIEKGRLFDIAMIDWLMPDMDGIETTRQIRKLVGQDTMIIIISAYDWSSIEEEARAAGASYFISKPLFQSAVYDTLLNLKIKPYPSNVDKQYHLKGLKVLLVEDNELNMEIAKALLEYQGVEVDTAENGQEALDKFLQSSCQYYTAILMDIRMPVMDGLSASRKIRQSRHPDASTMPIIAMTANAFEEDKALALSAGMNSYLVKPIDVNLLFLELTKAGTLNK